MYIYTLLCIYIVNYNNIFLKNNKLKEKRKKHILTGLKIVYSYNKLICFSMF